MKTFGCHIGLSVCVASVGFNHRAISIVIYVYELNESKGKLGIAEFCADLTHTKVPPVLT